MIIKKKIGKNLLNFKKEFKGLENFWVSYDYHLKNISYSDHFEQTNFNRITMERKEGSIYQLSPETIKLIKKFILNNR